MKLVIKEASEEQLEEAAPAWWQHVKHAFSANKNANKRDALIQVNKLKKAFGKEPRVDLLAQVARDAKQTGQDTAGQLKTVIKQLNKFYKGTEAIDSAGNMTPEAKAAIEELAAMVVASTTNTQNAAGAAGRSGIMGQIQNPGGQVAQQRGPTAPQNIPNGQGGGTVPQAAQTSGAGNTADTAGSNASVEDLVKAFRSSKQINPFYQTLRPAIKGDYARQTISGELNNMLSKLFTSLTTMNVLAEASQNFDFANFIETDIKRVFSTTGGDPNNLSKALLNSLRSWCLETAEGKSLVTKTKITPETPGDNFAAFLKGKYEPVQAGVTAGDWSKPNSNPTGFGASGGERPLGPDNSTTTPESSVEPPPAAVTAQALPDLSTIPDAGPAQEVKDREINGKSSLEEINPNYVLGDVKWNGQEAKLLNYASKNQSDSEITKEYVFAMILTSGPNAGKTSSFIADKEHLSDFRPKQKATNESKIFKKNSRGVFVIKG